ncbi:MAG: hypothetical protein JWQ40_1156 [Segetibacter sp.]|nr:hypothetical protein [Segetibacter sp.]
MFNVESLTLLLLLIKVGAVIEIIKNELPCRCNKVLRLKNDTRTVLCVDDDPDDREMVCTVIKDIDPSFTVIHAENGLEAHNILKKAKVTGQFPCLVILDINMPIMDGKETLVKIKEDTTLSKIPVAMFSTSSNEADKKFFSQYGVELVTKPNNINSIVNEVGKLLSYCSTD